MYTSRKITVRRRSSRSTLVQSSQRCTCLKNGFYPKFDGLVFVFFVDNGIITSADDSTIQRFIEELRDGKFDLGIEADYAGYLGVDIIAQPGGSLLMSQTGLIQRILMDFGLTDSASTKITPAAKLLGPFKASPPFEDHTYN
jgi:hypothetical protein